RIPPVRYTERKIPRHEARPVIPRPTRVLPINLTDPDPDTIRVAAAVIRGGGLVAFPTETVYGLGANALDPAAVRSVFEAKGRPAGNPLIIHVADERMCGRVVASWPESARLLAARFWPGPLTLVLPKVAGVPLEVTGGGPTVGVRMPGHPVALALIREVGVPLAAPSANRSSQVSPTRAEHVRAGLDGQIDLILDAGPTTNGIESTVLDLTTDPPTQLRPGPISRSELEQAIGPIRGRNAVSATGPLPSPGLLPRHYAPRTAVELFATAADAEARAAELRATGARVAIVVIGGQSGGDVFSMPAEATGYAARLYDVMHDLDGRGLSRVLIELPIDSDEWHAVRDRLTRAAAR
ncbi:MAG TPA: L-threonylcarbamoyladenylate synthase, partial [Gemmataceae bacterium]|nr:L-threonylcarbamoyladenylate synthase [Gemmataceae bacterium]